MATPKNTRHIENARRSRGQLSAYFGQRSSARTIVLHATDCVRVV